MDYSQDTGDLLQQPYFYTKLKYIILETLFTHFKIKRGGVAVGGGGGGGICVCESGGGGGGAYNTHSHIL